MQFSQAYVIGTIIMINKISVESKRISLLNDEIYLPFLASESNNEPQYVEWKDPEWLGYIEKSRFLELSSKGARTINYKKKIKKFDNALDQWYLEKTQCKVSYNALCEIVTQNSSNTTYLIPVLPSKSFDKDLWIDGYWFENNKQPKHSIELLNILQKKSIESCKKKGTGRKYVKPETYQNSNIYTITSCDILFGSQFLMYDTSNDILYLKSESLNPMSHLVVLAIVILNMYCISSEITPYNKETFKKGFNTPFYIVYLNISVIFCLLLSYIIHYPQYSFLILEEEIIFFCTALTCIIYSLVWLIIKGSEHDDNVLISSLFLSISAMSTESHKSCENPYMPLLTFSYSIILWKSVYFNCCYEHAENNSWLSIFKLCIDVTLICLYIEYSIHSQYEHNEEIWIIYISLMIFISFMIHLIITIN